MKWGHMIDGRSLRGNVDRNTSSTRYVCTPRYVVPYVGTWIEMRCHPDCKSDGLVVPYVGTWIEIFAPGRRTKLDRVVPYVGTWIEIFLCCFRGARAPVVPYVGTWIEMSYERNIELNNPMSFPTWERG